MAVDARGLVREFTRARAVGYVAGVRLYLADELVPLWQAMEWQAAGPQPPPFWAFAWPGSLALGRYLVETPETVRGKRVLDFGSGSGLSAIVAAQRGAAHIVATDVDPLALVAQRLNAELNGVAFDARCQDAIATPVTPAPEVVLAGDVWYEREPAERITAWLRTLTTRGTEVLIADPGRQYVPTDGLELLAEYDVPTLHELESTEHKRTRVWRLTKRSP